MKWVVKSLLWVTLAFEKSRDHMHLSSHILHQTHVGTLSHPTIWLCFSSIWYIRFQIVKKCFILFDQSIKKVQLMKPLKLTTRKCIYDNIKLTTNSKWTSLNIRIDNMPKMNVVNKSFYRVHAVHVVAAYTTTFICMLWIWFVYYNIHCHVVDFICISQRAIMFFFWAHHLINENPLRGFGTLPLI